MSAQTLYSGPGKVRYSFAGTPYVFHAEGENGQVKLAVNEKRASRSSATFGYHKSTLDDQTLELTFTPFDMWALLPALYPTYLGISTLVGGSVNTGALAIGARPHDMAAGASDGVPAPNGLANTTVWTADGRLYTIIRSAITQHPGMKLGVGQPLFDQVKITGLWEPGTYPGSANSPSTNFLAFQPAPVGDPDAPGFTPDFINGHWFANWGSGSNYAAFQNMEVEDFWTLSVNARYSPLTVQKLTRHMKLDSVEIIIKGRPQGPLHSDLMNFALAHQLGNALGENPGQALTLTGPGNKQIILNDAELFMENQGFEFGGTKLGTGEIAFISTLDFGGGKPEPVLTFSK